VNENNKVSYSEILAIFSSNLNEFRTYKNRVIMKQTKLHSFEKSTAREMMNSQIC